MDKASDFLKRGWGDLLVGVLALLWAIVVLAEWPPGTLLTLSVALGKLCGWEISGGFALAALGRGYGRLTGQTPST